MPRARYTAEGGVYRVGGHSFEPGDEHEVDRDLAEHLADVEDFVVTVEKTADSSEEADDADDGDEGEPDSADDQDAESFDVEAFVNRTPMDDVVEDIEAGEVDDHLDAVQTAEQDGRDRVGVQDAIGQRRAELEG